MNLKGSDIVGGIDWGLALQCLAAGVTGVFLVMILLQVSIPLMSSIVRLIEKPKDQAKQTS